MGPFIARAHDRVQEEPIEPRPHRLHRPHTGDWVDDSQRQIRCSCGWITSLNHPTVAFPYNQWVMHRREMGYH